MELVPAPRLPPLPHSPTRLLLLNITASYHKTSNTYYIRTIRAIQCVLLTVAAAFLPTVNGVDLELVPFYESMSEGDSVVLAEHGPFTLSASCDSSATTLDVYVEATQEDYIFSDQDSPVNLMAGNTTSYPGVFSETNYGNDYADGGFVSASGYYVGWNGESVIALHTSSGATEDPFGDNVSCVISGVLQLIQQ